MTPFTSLLLVAALAPGQSDAPPAWKLKKGDTFYVKTVNSNKQTVEFLGQSQNQDSDSTTFHKYEVLSADKDGMVIEQTIQKAVVKSPVPGAGDIGDKMKGLKLKFTVTPKNEVTKVEGHDKYVAALGGDDETTKALMKLVYSEDTLKMSVAEVFAFLPPKPVKKGDTWKRDSKFALGPVGDFAVNAEYKLADSTDKGEKITWKADTKYTPPKGDGGGGLPFAVTKGDLKAEKFEGEYLFDAKAGRLVSGTTAAKIAGKMTISAMGQEVEVEMKQDLTTKTTVSDKSQADE